MTNIDESTTNDPDNEEQNPVETPTPSDYFDDLEQKENISIYPDEEMSDVENRYLNNRDHVKNKKGADKAGPGLRSQKELFCTLNFAVWKKVYGMTI